MPKYMSNSSIKTIWENNSDTPITATNLSKALDLIASYKDFNKTSDFQSLHKEYSLLAINPEDDSQLLFKRGSILQIINEATNDLGEPMVPINEHYKIFDVGLDDIILTSNQTDMSLEGDKSVWGSNGDTKKWFVFLCDKDDSTIYNKGTDNEYGGGAQIIISNSNEKPQNVGVPGRTDIGDLYTEDDTRIIGGFKTYNNTITEVWDISGRYYSVKSKDGYYILDEFSGNDDYLYRKIDVRDLNTNRNSVFDGSITVNQNSNLIGGLDLSGTVQINSNNFKVDSTLGNASFHFTDTGIGSINIKSNLSVEGVVNFASSDFTIVGDVAHYGSFIEREGDFDIEGKIIHKGNLDMTGDINQSGTVTMGGRNETLSSEGIWYHNGEFDHTGVYKIDGEVQVSGRYSLASDDLEFRAITPKGWDTDTDSPIYHKFQIRVQDPIDVENDPYNHYDPTIYTYHQGTMEVYGATWSHSDFASFSINYDGNHKMFAYAKGFEYSDQGDGPSGGYKITSDLIVQDDSTNILLNVKRLEKEVYITGSTDVHLKYDNNTFTVSGDSGPIFSVEKNPDQIVMSDNLIVTAGKTINGRLEGLADKAIEFNNPLTLNFASSNSDMSTGSVTFTGNEETAVVDLMIDRSKWHNIEDFDNGELDRRYYTEAELNPSFNSAPALQQSEVNFSITGALDLRYYTEQEIDQRLGGTNGTGVDWTTLISRPVYTLVEDLKNGGISSAAEINLNVDTDDDFTLNINPDGHTHTDIYYQTESDERYYTKGDLTNYTSNFNEGLPPTIHWNVLTNVPYSNIGGKNVVAREDHIHSFALDIYNSKMSIAENINLNLVDYFTKIDFLNPYTVIRLNNAPSLRVAEDYLIFDSFNGLIKFWFYDANYNGGLGNTEPISNAVYASEVIDITGITTEQDLITAMNNVISLRAEFTTSINSGSITINYETNTETFIPDFIFYPYSQNSNFISVNANSFSAYNLHLASDQLAYNTNTQYIEDIENYVLTKNLHVNISHKLMGTNKENLLLNSQSSDFLNTVPSSSITDHAANMYSTLNGYANPSTHNDNSRKVSDKVAIHINNIYVPHEYTPNDGYTALRDFLDVRSEFDTQTGEINYYNIQDMPIIQYLEENYPTRSELGGGTGSVNLSDQYYLKSVINPSAADPGTEASTRTDVDWDTETNLDWRYYTEYELNPNDSSSVEASTGTMNADFSVTAPLDYRYYDKFELNPGLGSSIKPSGSRTDTDFITPAPLDYRYYTIEELNGFLANKDNYLHWTIATPDTPGGWNVESGNNINLLNGTNISITHDMDDITIEAGVFNILSGSIVVNSSTDMTLQITQNNGINTDTMHSIDISHNHSDIYYTELQLNPNPGSDAGSGVLDDRYYTKTYVDNNFDNYEFFGFIIDNTSVGGTRAVTEIGNTEHIAFIPGSNITLTSMESGYGLEITSKDTYVTSLSFSGTTGQIEMGFNDGGSELSGIDLDTRYYTETELDPNPGTDDGTGQLDTRYYTESEVASMTDQLVQRMVNAFDQAYDTTTRPEDPSVDTYVEVNINSGHSNNIIAGRTEPAYENSDPNTYSSVSNNQLTINYSDYNVTSPVSSTPLIQVTHNTGQAAIAEEGTFSFQDNTYPDYPLLGYDSKHMVLYDKNNNSYGIGWRMGGNTYTNPTDGTGNPIYDYWINVNKTTYEGSTNLNYTDQVSVLISATIDWINNNPDFLSAFSASSTTGDAMIVAWSTVGNVTLPDLSNTYYDGSSGGGYTGNLVSYSQAQDGQDKINDSSILTFNDDTVNNNSNYEEAYVDISNHLNEIYRVWYNLSSIAVVNPFTGSSITRTY